jgi:hypothetical protein
MRRGLAPNKSTRKGKLQKIRVEQEREATNLEGRLENHINSPSIRGLGLLRLLTQNLGSHM